MIRRTIEISGHGNHLYVSRSCASQENTDVHANRVIAALPPDGEVRLLRITDKQFERMQVFWGKMRKPTEKAPQQLQLF